MCLDRVDDGGHDDGEEHISVEECSFAEGGAGDGIGRLAEYEPDYPALVVVIFEVQLDQVEASRTEEARLVAVGKFVSEDEVDQADDHHVHYESMDDAP